MARIRTRALTGKLNQLRLSLIALLNDFRPVWQEQTPIIQQTMADKIRGGISPPIKQATRKWRQRHGYSPSEPPLIASRKLIQSLQGGAGSIVRPNRKTLEVGTNLPEAAPNQFGATINVRRKSEKQRRSGKGRKSKVILYTFQIPARPFTPDVESESFLIKLSRQMENFLTRYVLRQQLDQRPKE